MKEYHKIHGLYKRYTKGEKKGKFIIGEYSKPEFALLKDITWIWTEKIDGTNIRVQFYNNKVLPHIEFKGKTDKAEIPKHLFEYLEKIFTLERMERVFELSEEKPDICLYGEGYGYKIQKGDKYFGGKQEVGFILFDVQIGDIWLKREDIMDIAEKLGIKIVPFLGQGTIDEAISYVKMNPPSCFGNQDFIIEGLVIRPEYELLDRRGHRIITKIKVNDFKEE